MKRDLEHYKQLARQANAAGDYSTVGMIIGLRLVPLFEDDHAAAHRFFTELEQSAPTVMYQPMKED